MASVRERWRFSSDDEGVSLRELSWPVAVRVYREAEAGGLAGQADGACRGSCPPRTPVRRRLRGHSIRHDEGDRQGGPGRGHQQHHGADSVESIVAAAFFGNSRLRAVSIKWLRRVRNDFA